MASAFAHALTSYALGRLTLPKGTTKVLVLGAICSVLPDADVLAFRFGIPYTSPFGHRGFTHSILFAALLALFLTSLFTSRENTKTANRSNIFLFLFFSTLSHGLLDALTNGGLGVAFFFPIDNTRYFLPWRPIQVSPIEASAFFGEWGLRVIRSEMIWVGIPSLVAIVIGAIIQRRKRKNKETA